MDKSVLENRLAVKRLVQKVYGKGKVVVVCAAVGLVIVFSIASEADAIGFTPMPQAPITRIDNRIGSSNNKVVPSNARLDVRKQDKIVFVKPRELPLCIYLMDDQFLVNPKVSKLVKELRGGSWENVMLANVIFLALLYGIWWIAGGG